MEGEPLILQSFHTFMQPYCASMPVNANIQNDVLHAIVRLAIMIEFLTSSQEADYTKAKVYQRRYPKIELLCSKHTL
jgi:hypothetical protein